MRFKHLLQKAYIFHKEKKVKIKNKYLYLMHVVVTNTNLLCVLQFERKQLRNQLNLPCHSFYKENGLLLYVKQFCEYQDMLCVIIWICINIFACTNLNFIRKLCRVQAGTGFYCISNHNKIFNYPSISIKSQADLSYSVDCNLTF